MNSRIPAFLIALPIAMSALPVRGEPAPVVSVTSTTAISYDVPRQCWAELITKGDRFREERERIRNETAWYVPYLVPVGGTVLGAYAGSQFGQGTATTVMTVAGGIAGYLLGPGAIAGAWLGGAFFEAVVDHLAGEGRLREAAAVAGAIAGAVAGKSLFDQFVASVSPYYADAQKDPPEKPDALMQVERCGEQPRLRHEESAFVVVYHHDSGQRSVTLPFDPGDTVEVDSTGRVDLAAYRDGVLQP